ncbi:MAG: hypothetical protein RLZZ630_1887 [Bacteroidota bacterium]|jgi:uncharacterized protein (TIGR02145 family)
MKSITKLLIAAAMVLWFHLPLLAQVDCNTPQGVLALMVPATVKDTPSGPHTYDLNPSTYPIGWSADLFLQPQNATTTSTCFSKITYYVFASTTSSNLSNLPNLASSNDNFTVPSGVRKYTATIRNDVISGGNLIAGRVEIPRSNFTVETTVYYRVARRVDNCSTCIGPDPYTWSNTFSFKAPPMPIIDASGNYYQIDTIGNQVWMLENLRTKKYRNGTNIVSALPSTITSTINIGTVSFCGDTIHGTVYNYYAVANTAGLCPAGWHVPTLTEWNSLFSLVGGAPVAGKLKMPIVFDSEVSNNGAYFSPNTGAGNAPIEMNIPSTSMISTQGNCSGEFYFARLWSSSIVKGSTQSNSVKFSYNSGGVETEQNSKSAMLSVRCKKD